MANWIVHSGLIGTVIAQIYLLQQYFGVLLGSLSARRNELLAYIAAGLMLLIAVESFAPGLEKELCFFIGIFVISSLYQVPLITRGIYSIIYLILEIAGEALAESMAGRLHITSHSPDARVYGNDLLIFLLFFLFMFGVIHLIKQIKRMKESRLYASSFVIILSVTLLSLFLTAILVFLCTNPLFHFMAVVCILVMVILFIYLFDRVAEKFKLAEMNYRLRKQMDIQHDNYENITRSFKGVRKVVHDTNKHMIYLERCIEEGRSQEALEHIRLVLSRMEGSFKKVNTGHPVIDALVSHALDLAHEQQADIDYKVNICTAEIVIENYDICVVLGNILENAVEALQGMAAHEHKYLKIRILSDPHSLYMNTVNSCPEIKQTPLKYKGIHQDFHGFGLENVKGIVDKYGGDLKVQAEAGTFEVIVVIPLESDYK
ncbi:hypothetical protein DCC85_05700 [Paenibacillus sp. CAA11]|uniref:sensor histidine kinase n=1 Tax=Paenibacillus sp. CAA11 TaxID=1532905 RepID=UPI000D3978E1|nr:GHKL domain-containing protein [Paenibacillus sp. CAA11]AWB43765.1 hypothetical protein DCC85_05700 [Paenibacillus sp. CAA11]